MPYHRNLIQTEAKDYKRCPDSRALINTNSAEFIKLKRQKSTQNTLLEQINILNKRIEELEKQING